MILALKISPLFLVSFIFETQGIILIALWLLFTGSL